MRTQVCSTACLWGNVQRHTVISIVRSITSAALCCVQEVHLLATPAFLDENVVARTKLASPEAVLAKH